MDEERLKAMLEEIAIDPGTRKQYYALKHLRHADDCPRGGDQCCPCGKSQTYCNIDSLLDSCEAAYHVLLGHTVTEAYAIVARRIETDSHSSANGEPRG